VFESGKLGTESWNGWLNIETEREVGIEKLGTETERLKADNWNWKLNNGME
jgi:hypothetical protein